MVWINRNPPVRKSVFSTGDPGKPPQYSSTGCDRCDDCLDCPFPKCRYDDKVPVVRGVVSRKQRVEAVQCKS